MKQLLLIFIAVLFSGAPAMAQVRPQPGMGDPRIQSVAYDANQVVRLEVAPGYQLTVELAPDEHIESVAVGDSGAWQVIASKRGDHLFIKPNTSDTTTDVTVVTDIRSYLFELAPGTEDSSPYIVRFRYPGAISLRAINQPPPPKSGLYKVSGTKALRPDAISDDGKKTFIEWRADRAMPAVLALGDDGKEMLIDGAVRNGQYVIDSVHPRLVFRLDNKSARAKRVPQDRP